MPSPKLSAKPKVKPATRQFSFEAIGTRWRITIKTALSKIAAQKLLGVIQQRIEQFDRHYSRFRVDSLISAIAQQAGRYRLPDDARPLFDLYQRLYELTDEAMTPLIGQLLSDAGYDAEYSLQPSQLQPTPSWAEALEYDFPHLKVKQPVLLDLGAAGKGYLVDIVAQLLQDAGMTDFCIDAGGDILQRQATDRATTKTATTIGLEHPDHPEQVIGIASLRNQSLCGSAGNRRVWDSYHHIIDPRTQSSPVHLRAVWVVADSTLLADGLATALFFTEAAKLNKWYAFEYALIYADYSLEHSPHFPAEFFTEQRSA